MQLASPRLEQWPSVIGHVSSLMDLDASARLHGALVRKRGVRNAADLLHLGLLYGPGGLSLRAVANHARGRDRRSGRRLAARSTAQCRGGFAELRARDPRLARSWLLAHLIAAVLIEASLSEALDSPP